MSSLKKKMGVWSIPLGRFHRARLGDLDLNVACKHLTLPYKTQKLELDLNRSRLKPLQK